MTEPASLLRLTLPSLPTFDLPPRLPVTDPELERQVFTHSSYHARPRKATSLDMDDDQLLDNEKLEHVGDSLLGQVVTTLLHKLYPNLRAGPATTLKSHLVSNTTLSQLSHKYDLPKYLIASYAQLYNLQNGEKTSANIFEAYVAGVYYSFLNPTKTRMPTPLRTPSKSGFDEHVIKTPHSTQPTNGQALDQVESWLHPLFTPIAEWTLGQLKAEQARLEAMTAEKRGDKYLDQHAAGAMARLNEHCIVRERGIPEYISSRAGSDMWSVMCVATLKDGTRLSEDATRSTKKLASAVAAWKICQKLGI